jgi:hypothetical protein
MANWLNPTITTQYDVFVNEAKDRDVDSATMFLNAASLSSPPIGSIRLNRLGAGFYKLQEWDVPGSFYERYLHVSGGGTGASEPAGARSNLGIGTMGVQNSNAVSISGGVIGNLSGFGISCSIIFNAGAAYDLGTNAAKCRRGYFSDAVVLPVGVDKFATS